MVDNADTALLALIMGVSLGSITFWLWRWSPGRVLAVNILFFFASTFAQQVYRIFDGQGSVDELIYISALRIIFAASAVIAVWLLWRIREETDG
jgi:hypothetical protein